MTFMEAVMLLAGALLTLLGLIALASSPKLFFEARRADREARRTTGHVIELIEVPPTGRDSDMSTWHPVVRFEDEDGHEHVFDSRYGTGPSKWTVGDSVSVAYPPLKPGEARIDHPIIAYHSVLVALLIAFVFLGSGTLLVLLAFFHD